MPSEIHYDDNAVKEAIANSLEEFYGTLIKKIDDINIKKL